MEAAKTTSEKSTVEKCANYVLSRIHYIEGLEQGEQAAKLAVLRKGAGKEPGQLPEAWNIIFDGFPEAMMGKTKASWEEESVYTALTLYAVHQRGRNPEKESMNGSGETAGMTLGKAVGTMAVQKGTDEDTIYKEVKRLQRLAASFDTKVLGVRLRGIIDLLRDADVQLDYGAVTRDLYSFHNRQSRPDILRRWGEDFYKVINAAKLKPAADDNQNPGGNV
jgi:CRISPR system Cascade subunit CasB